jgi:hypothetical protein
MAKENVVDIIFAVNMVFKFLTTYPTGPGEYETSLLSLFMNYAKGTMLLDAASTIPTLMSG